MTAPKDVGQASSLSSGSEDRLEACPTLSVIIPAYGHARFVRAAAESAVGDDVEVIVVNDGSPDDTADVLRPLLDSIRYVEQPNAGQAAARNCGLSLARGEFVAFLDDDDLYPPGRIERHVAILKADPSLVGVYSPYDLIDAEGDPLPDERPGDYPSGDVRRAFRERCWMVSPGQATWRRSHVEAVGGLDESIWGSDDWDLYIRLSDRGPVAFDPTPALKYRWHGGNASGRAALHARNHLRVVRRHLFPDPRLVWRCQRGAAAYFVPKLEALADAERAAGRFGASLGANLWQLAFAPSRVASPSWWRSALRAALRRPM